LSYFSQTFDEAFKIKSEAVGQVDMSKHLPDWMVENKSIEGSSKALAQEYKSKALAQEYKYCGALHKIAVLERIVQYLSVESTK